jgi:RNA polymerase sigma factor (TIGR02999 family)
MNQATDRTRVTEFLVRLDRGEPASADTILPAVYDELRRLANHHLGSERADHTLQTTALVHEAYLRLVDQNRVAWNGRRHFMAVASLAMRRLLVDHARSRGRAKRGGDVEMLALTESLPVAGPDRAAEIIALDELLETLLDFDERAARVVECRFFAGLSIEETAEALDVSPMTVKRSWRLARAWLRRELDARGPARGGDRS